MTNWYGTAYSAAHLVYKKISGKTLAFGLLAAGTALTFHHHHAHASTLYSNPVAGSSSAVHTPWAESVKKHFSSPQANNFLPNDPTESSTDSDEALSTAVQNSKWSQTGGASWYTGRFPHGRQQLTAAHRTLPFGTKVMVQSPDTGRSIIVTITDRGPYIRGRIIDLSRNAAVKLGILRRGTGHVVISKIDSKSMPMEVAEAPQK
ncbi:septal ring lytic transglycosylase RlpA family protein [Entomobacter blattae]|uniref:septal ring lytic transglycosylase RlpA family protein n=1 Tax=Entomobacter blattae TaxID=2762277 RepID=UPI001EEFBE2E|nr:RlpA-like double-psi beta-barrel domain-containing protein [Entomobacter blattae]